MNSAVKLTISSAIIIFVIISSHINLNLNLTNPIGSNLTGDSVNNPSNNAQTLRLGYFPNVNHAPAIIGVNNGEFEKNINNGRDGKNVSIQPFIFSAGPSAVEALFGNQIDVAFVGPTPAISGYFASEGDNLRIISGVSSGGVTFIVRNDTDITSVNDLGGKKFASPQLGNTQDISLRKFLIDNGYNTVDKGGNVTIVATKPADILTLFLKKEIDGAWVPEPWGAKLLKEANGRIFLDERDLWDPEREFTTSSIVVRTDYLRNNPEILEKFLEVHVNLTSWLNQTLSNTNSSQISNPNINNIIFEFNDGLEKITGKTIPEDELRESFSRIEFTYDPLSQTLFKIAEDTKNLGFLKTAENSLIDLSKIYDLKLLNQVLNKMGLEPVI